MSEKERGTRSERARARARESGMTTMPNAVVIHTHVVKGPPQNMGTGAGRRMGATDGTAIFPRYCCFPSPVVLVRTYTRPAFHYTHSRMDARQSRPKASRLTRQSGCPLPRLPTTPCINVQCNGRYDEHQVYVRTCWSHTPHTTEHCQRKQPTCTSPCRQSPATLR